MMNQKKDSLEKVIQSELKKEAENTQKGYEAAGSQKISEELREDMKEQLQDKIAQYELEKVYEKLPERDRKALELGREIMDRKETEKEEPLKVSGSIRYRKKLWKMYGMVAAALVLALAIGVTSFGGAERIIAIVKSVVGGREVVQVDSNEDNMVIAKENEEEAYQAVQKAFGVEPVKIFTRPQNMKFVSAEIDEKLQIAEFLYKYQGKNVIYIISAMYADSSLGVDVEDEVIEEYCLDVEGQKVTIKGYRTPETKETRYSAKFSYMNLEYFFITTIDKAEFEKIVKKLYFYNL